MPAPIGESANRGFSLVEMLVVIAVIGILASISVTAIGSVTAKANATKAKRNAQNLAAVGSSAQAVGFQYVSHRKRRATKELIAGVTGTGQFETTVFRVPNLSRSQLRETLRYLKFENATPVYKAHKQPPDPEDEEDEANEV